jgi:quinol-cytochrome oxidoreductase complex cytochrome b subunit
MAEIVTIDGKQYKKRSPFGAWLLIFPTFGIYLLVWFYKINKELRQYLNDDSIKPGLLTFSQIVPIWNYYTTYQTGERIGRAEQKAGLTVSVQPILGLVAHIVLLLHILYYQSELNKLWDAASVAGSAAPLFPSTSPQVPPPPPAG